MYPTGRQMVTVAQGVDLNSLADVGRFTPGPVPYIIRGVYLAITNDLAAAGEVRVDKRVTQGSDTGRGDGDVAILNLLGTHTGGQVVYRRNLNVQINPGEEAVVQVTDVTGAADVCDVIFDVERKPDVPGNFTAMVAST